MYCGCLHCNQFLSLLFIHVTLEISSISFSAHSIVFFCSFRCILLSFLCCFVSCYISLLISRQPEWLYLTIILVFTIINIVCILIIILAILLVIIISSSSFSLSSSSSSSLSSSSSSSTVPAVGESRQPLRAIFPRPSARIRYFFGSDQILVLAQLRYFSSL